MEWESEGVTTIEYESVAFDKIWEEKITFDTDDEDELARLWWEHCCTNGIITAVRK